MTSAQLKKDGALLETAPLAGLEIRQLRAFVALVEQKRVTAAAEALGLAQSTVSEALSALERALDTPLILRRRGGHSLELTEAGRALLPHARKILSAVDDAHTAIAAAASRAQTHVEIVANESVSTYLLPSILPTLRQHWPQTRFTVSVATCAGVREGVAGGAFDVGLLLEELEVDGSSAPHEHIARTIYRASRGRSGRSARVVRRRLAPVDRWPVGAARCAATRSWAIRCSSATARETSTTSCGGSSKAMVSTGRRLRRQAASKA